MEERTTLNYIKIFFLVVIICALISLVYRSVLLVKNSSYKYEAFNLLLLDRDAYLVHVEGGDNKVSILKIKNAGAALEKKSRLSQSLLLGIFIDGSIISKSQDGFSGVDKDFLKLGKFLSLATNPNFHKNNLNDYDLLKIYMEANGASKINKESKTIEKLDTDKYLGDTIDFFQFSDPEIFNSKISIQVLNGTEVNGFATRVGAILQTLGYNVVETGSTESSKSSITSSSITPNIERVAKFLNAPIVESEDTGIADIKVVLGEDLLKK